MNEVSKRKIDEIKIIEDLNTQIVGKDIISLDEIDSTNTYAKNLAKGKCKNGTVVITKKQLAGRGRMGRVWSSQNENGIWMSIILVPDSSVENIQCITLMAAVAIVKAIQGSVGIQGGIKWPNDIIVDGKKVCGILTEMVENQDGDKAVVIGIGVNVNQSKEDFQGELEDKAISLAMVLKRSLNKSDILKYILNELDYMYSLFINNNMDKILKQWKDNTVTLGNQILITINGETIIALAKDIDKEGNLVIECIDGTIKKISSGEISIRGILGYA